MKKLQLKVMIFLSVLAMLSSIAAAPMAGSALTLIEVRNDWGGGVLFVFRVDGHFSKSELNGLVQVQGEGATYGLHCNQVDDNTVQCSTSKKTAGRNVVITFGGSTFFAFVPEAVIKYCYNVYDVGGLRGIQFDPMLVTVHCQGVPANDGDVIEEDSPNFGPNQSYTYLHLIVFSCNSPTFDEEAYFSLNGIYRSTKCV